MEKKKFFTYFIE